MREKPILFSTPMVQAILEDRKTHTRRINKDLHQHCEVFCYDFERRTYGITEFTPNGEQICQVEKLLEYSCEDVLWVKETYFAYGKWVIDGTTKTDKPKRKFITDFTKLIYYIDTLPAELEVKKNNQLYESGYFKRNGRFMPRKAARIFLKVTDVRVEPLQDITPSECIAEGVIDDTCQRCLDVWGSCKPQSDVDVFCGNEEQIIEIYAELWDSLNVKQGYDWESNPWVWVIEFERVENYGTIDK